MALIARAIELCSSFNPARVTLDAHADALLGGLVTNESLYLRLD